MANESESWRAPNRLSELMSTRARQLTGGSRDAIGDQALATRINTYYVGSNHRDAERIVSPRTIRDHRDDLARTIQPGKERWLVVAAVLFDLTEEEANELFRQKGLPTVAGLREMLTDPRDLELIWSDWPQTESDELQALSEQIGFTDKVPHDDEGYLRGDLERLVELASTELDNGSFQHDPLLQEQITDDRNFLQRELARSPDIDAAIAVPLAQRLEAALVPAVPDNQPGKELSAALASVADPNPRDSAAPIAAADLGEPEASSLEAQAEVDLQTTTGERYTLTIDVGQSASLGDLGQLLLDLEALMSVAMVWGEQERQLATQEQSDDPGTATTAARPVTDLGGDAPQVISLTYKNPIEILLGGAAASFAALAGLLKVVVELRNSDNATRSINRDKTAAETRKINADAEMVEAETEQKNAETMLLQTELERDELDNLLRAEVYANLIKILPNLDLRASPEMVDELLAKDPSVHAALARLTQYPSIELRRQLLAGDPAASLDVGDETDQIP